MQFRTVIMTGSWRCGSTALNLSLIQHPGIFGWIEETNFLKVVRAPDGWKEGQWIIQKNPQYARVIAKVVQECPPNRVILLARNPYAICRSMLDPLFARTRSGSTIENASAHIMTHYQSLLAQEAETPKLFYRAHYEDFVKNPRERLTELLENVFGLPFDEKCLSWEKKPIRLGLGDPKAADTSGWHEDAAETWRAGLSREQKEYIRTACLPIFEALEYDPNDL